MTETATESTTKSIIDPKYRNKYKTPDWLGELIAKHATASHTVEVPEKKDDKGKVISKATTKTVTDGVDVNALNALAAENGIEAEKYAAMNVGQQRMNIGNRLRSLTLKRHGLAVGGKWVKADEAWLKSKNAPEAPTHNKDGSAIAKPKEAKAAAPAKAAPAEPLANTKANAKANKSK